jgi:hypothetical protein
MSEEEKESYDLESQISGLYQDLNFQTKVAFRNQSQIASLEDALAAATEMLLTYKDYYGTSIAQVKHLQECTDCYLAIDAEQVRCFDYPAE